MLVVSFILLDRPISQLGLKSRPSSNNVINVIWLLEKAGRLERNQSTAGGISDDFGPISGPGFGQDVAHVPEHGVQTDG